MRASREFKEILVHTGQHYDSNMSEVFFDELGIPKPDYNFGIATGSHGEMTGRMLEAIESVLLKESPNIVFVYGDTKSTLAGSIAAAKLHIPVAHVEAGLRSFNKAMPEELNRILTDHVSRWLFCPTDTSVKNLRNEGIIESDTYLVGDVMFDASLYFSTQAQAKSTILNRLGLESRKYILSTFHRAENTDVKSRLDAILLGLGKAAQVHPVVIPLHPRTRAAIKRFDIKSDPKIIFIDPVGHLDMTQLERHARLIATDSGGVQKTFFFRTPCVTLRDETE